MSQSVLEPAFALVGPQKIVDIRIDLGAAKQVLKRLGREPAAPITAETGAKEKDVAQGPSLSNNYGRSAARFSRRTDSDLQILPERHQKF